MKKFVSLLGLLVLVSGFQAAWGMGGPAPDKPAEQTALAGKILLIDDFESANLRSPREWWTFDITTAAPASNKDLKSGDAKVASEAGNYSLLLSGMAKDWYAGGCGTYIARERQDLSKYNQFVLDIYGNGPGSGMLKIELVDDDNNNWQVEQDAAKNYALIYDDKFVYEQRVDWTGWKRLYIPMADFVDDNPMVGDDIWNPQQVGASGGLLQFQFICIASSDRGKVNYNVDNIMLAVGQ